MGRSKAENRQHFLIPPGRIVVAQMCRNMDRIESIRKSTEGLAEEFKISNHLIIKELQRLVTSDYD